MLHDHDATFQIACRNVAKITAKNIYKDILTNMIYIFFKSKIFQINLKQLNLPNYDFAKG